MAKGHFSKKNATTFQLVHRSQRDPEIHNDEASQRVLVPVQNTSRSGENFESQDRSGHIQSKQELEQMFASKIRDNEGEAAEYGIMYDDSDYDYMQHLRPTGNIGAVLLETPKANPVVRSSPILLPPEVQPSQVERLMNYEDQQSIQDSVTGFKPDLDYRIREVLQALETDSDLAATEVADESWFDELLGDKPAAELTAAAEDDEDDCSTINGFDSREASNWTQDYATFKRAGQGFIDEDGGSVVSNAYTAASDGRIKHGSGSIGTGFSMSSSALYRTEGLTLLDDRFDKLDLEYTIEEEDEEDMPNDCTVNDVTKQSATREDFDSIMDGFLTEFGNMGNKGRTKKARNPYTLDDARIALGSQSSNVLQPAKTRI